MLVTLALLAQAVSLAAHPAPKAAPIRVWIADSTVYVRLRDPGYLTVLHVDPVGRIRVLFPFNPDDNAAAPGGATFQLAAPVGAESGTATIVAARSSRPLQVAGCVRGRSGTMAAACCSSRPPATAPPRCSTSPTEWQMEAPSTSM